MRRESVDQSQQACHDQGRADQYGNDRQRRLRPRQQQHADDNRGEARCHEGRPGAPGEIWPESGLIDLRHLRVADALLTPGYRGASTGWFPASR